MYIRDPEVLTPKENQDCRASFSIHSLTIIYFHITFTTVCKIQIWAPDREGEGDGRKRRERNELYSIHYLVRDILRKTVSELPFFLGKESLFIGKAKKKKFKKSILESEQRINVEE